MACRLPKAARGRATPTNCRTRAELPWPKCRGRRQVARPRVASWYGVFARRFCGEPGANLGLS